MKTTPELESATLYYREGNSDKVYQCAVEPSGIGFVVNFAYGRRGSTLSTGTKTSTPVDHETARQVYDKLVREKMAKGYTPGPEGTPYQNTDKADRTTNILPQLLNPIEDPQPFINDFRYGAQEKFDGRRLLIRKVGSQIEGINRKGLLIGLPSVLVGAFAQLADCIIDGECIGEVFHAFDLLSVNGEDTRPLQYQQRYQLLRDLLAPVRHPSIRLAPLFTGSKEKAGLLHRLTAAKREGIVFRDLQAPYQAGRPNSGGPVLKHKFYATLSAAVSGINPQRSVELRLIGREGWVPVGNVTIPANHPVPAVGDVVEVRYLYAFPESKALFQPVYLGKRSDLDAAECMTVQLKFKPAHGEDE